MATAATETDLVLLGAGAAHLAVLRRFARRPPRRARLTLVAPAAEIPHPGRVARLVAGQDAGDGCWIDLAPLAVAAKARLILADPTGISPPDRTIALAGRPPLPFDLLSIDLPGESAMPQADAACVPTWPAERFLARIPALEATLPTGARIAVIGNRPAAPELVLALARRWVGRFRLALVSEGPEPLADAPALARRTVRAALVDAGVELASAVQAGMLREGRLQLSDGSFLAADLALWAGETRAPAFLAESGLACDAAGRAMVRHSLQTASHPAMFAAGDCAAVVAAPLQGAWLATTLRRAACHRRLPPWSPPPLPTLAMLDLGAGRAVAWHPRVAVSGRIVAEAKDRLDQHHLERHRLRPGRAHRSFRAPQPLVGAVVTDSPVPALASPAVARRPAPDALVGLAVPDHAAALTLPAGQALVQNIASLPACLDDLYVFGQIAAAHAMADLHGMGARPWTALAVAAAAPGARIGGAHDAMLAGAEQVLAADGCSLAGTQRSTAAAPSLTLAVSGLAEAGRLPRQAGLHAGDVLVLTKPLGSGLILTAHARGAARGGWLTAAIASMRASNAAAGHVLHGHGATACAAVNGLGLTGHLAALLGAGRQTAVLWPDEVPALPGALEVAGAGGAGAESAAAAALGRLLSDPQVAGGLLAGVPSKRVERCLAALREAGIGAAAIGMVEPFAPDVPQIRIGTVGSRGD